MRTNTLWLKLALAFAATTLLGVLVAALLIQKSTSVEFGRYLEHFGGMEGMMDGGMSTMMGAPETAFLSSVRNSLWIAGGLAIALAAALAVILSRQITAPLRRLSAAAGRVARGDLTCRLPSNSNDEVGALTNTFNRMVESLDMNQESRRKLMADLAHEMSTPLAVMQSNLEGMLDGVVETSPANVASLHEEALLLSRLVKDLRTLSQAEAGKLNLSPAPGDLVGLVSSVVRATEPEAMRKHVVLEFRSEPDLPKAMMDSDRVSQVLANLLSNALRYTSDGDSIEVAVARHSGNGNAGPGLLVSVADTGQGISEQDVPHIFDRYYQGAQPREKRAGGSGIGLAVVKELVEAHKGKVWLNSAPGEGSTFFFTLPTT